MEFCLWLRRRRRSSSLAAAVFGGGGQGRRSSTSSSRTYSSKGTVGDAVISIDPETRNLIVIADDETAAYIQQVVSNLDAPKPQVLIKVVFLEVSRKDGSDIGIEGTYNKNGNWSGGITNLSGGNIFGLANSGYAPIPPGAGLYQVFAQDYQVTLRAIAPRAKSKCCPSPPLSPATISPPPSTWANLFPSSRTCASTILATPSIPSATRMWASSCGSLPSSPATGWSK